MIVKMSNYNKGWKYFSDVYNFETALQSFGIHDKEDKYLKLMQERFDYCEYVILKTTKELGNTCVFPPVHLHFCTGKKGDDSRYYNVLTNTYVYLLNDEGKTVERIH